MGEAALSVDEVSDGLRLKAPGMDRTLAQTVLPSLEMARRQGPASLVTTTSG
jgi:hypothetical protein